MRATFQCALGPAQVGHQHRGAQARQRLRVGQHLAVSASWGSRRAGDEEPTSISRWPAAWQRSPFDLLRGGQHAGDALQAIAQADFTHHGACAIGAQRRTGSPVKMGSLSPNRGFNR